MRIQTLLRNLSLLLLFASPLLLRAQFQAPTPEELKMTDDPKAPGAAAVYLNLEEEVNDPLHIQNYYARIKVLQEKGKDLARVQIGYLSGFFKVENIEGRTIHADGTIIPLTVKPEELFSSKINYKQDNDIQFKQVVFTLPSVEVGSILEYRYRISAQDYQSSSLQSSGYRSTEPVWEVQRPYFVHHERFVFKPFKAFLSGVADGSGHFMIDPENGAPADTLIWTPNLPGNSKVQHDVSGVFRLEMNDVPATPEEEFMPPISSQLYRVEFYYKNANNAQNYWIEEGKRWSNDVNHFAEASKGLKEAVAALVAPTDSDLDKARKIYLAVQALDNTDYSRTKSQTERRELNLRNARHAEDIWNEKSGSSEEIALLYLAMLRSAGLTAYAEKLVDRQRGLFDVNYLRSRQLDDTLVVLSTGGKEIELDPGEKMCPFQTVSWRHSGAGGISQTANGTTTVTSATQMYSSNKTFRYGDVMLDAQGGMTASFRIAMTGQEALYWRQLALSNDETEVKKRFDASLISLMPEGVEAHVDHFAGLDDPYANLIAVVKAQGTLGVATAKRVILPAFFFETRVRHPFVTEEKRQTAVDMHYGETVIDQVAYHLPAGLSVEGTPQDADFSWPQHAIFKTQTAAVPGQVTTVRKFYGAFTFAKPEEYQDLRGFYQKIATADQQQLVLTTAPAAPKGN